MCRRLGRQMLAAAEADFQPDLSLRPGSGLVERQKPAG
jgi:hypothetical protein